MYLEDLPNELFGVIFSYLSGIDCVFAFSCLNQRFQYLIEKCSEELDFQFASKTQFEWFFEQYNQPWWKSLKLSNEHVFGQIEYFFQDYSLIDHVSGLRSLSLIDIHQLKQSILIDQLAFLPNLVSLTLKPVCGQDLSSIDLPNLKRLVIRSCRDTRWVKENFPQIESLDYEIVDCCSRDRSFIWPKLLKHLKLVYGREQDGSSIPSSLKHLSNLQILEIYQKELTNSVANGQVWEQLISSSFSQLKKFRFHFSLVCSSYSTNKIETLFLTFSTPFYTNEQKCFSQCDIFGQNERVSIYSVPFTFNQYQIPCDFYQSKIRSLSNSSQKHSYEKLRTLIVEWPVYELTPSLPHASDAKSILHFKSNDYFHSIEQIKFIHSYRYTPYYRRHFESFSRQFLLLFQMISRLRSLEMRFNELQALSGNFTNRSMCQFLSDKILSLKIDSNELLGDKYLGTDELNQISEVFGQNCQNLSITLLVSTEKVVSVLKHFQQLQCFHVHVQMNSQLEITNRWLENRQIGWNSTNCYVFNHRNIYYFFLNKEIGILSE